MTPLNQEPIVIAGGGIGGLAVAIGLARVGFNSVVLERGPQFGEIGAGIQLGPNAFHALDYLGVGEVARSAAVYIERLVLMDALSAQEIVSVPLDERFRARFGNPYAVAHRAELHRALLNVCRELPGVQLRSGAAVLGYAQDEARVCAKLENGEHIGGQVLIGADGLWSRIRESVVADGKPRVSGHTTYRSVIPRESMPEDLRWNAVALWAGPKCHVVHYPLSGRNLFNIVVTYHNEASAAIAGEPAELAEVMAGFARVHPRIQQIIRQGRDWKKWVLCDRDPTSSWVNGRVTLLGDAAHPQLQYMAQGACMALEDSVILSMECAATPHDLPSALYRYQERRRLRTARVQLQSRAIGEHIYHPSGVHAELRNQIMRAKSTAEWFDVLQWLYGADDMLAAKAAKKEHSDV
jgi:3-hydroxybenzoate 6-monooxygenase